MTLTSSWRHELPDFGPNSVGLRRAVRHFREGLLNPHRRGACRFRSLCEGIEGPPDAAAVLVERDREPRVATNRPLVNREVSRTEFHTDHLPSGPLPARFCHAHPFLVCQPVEQKQRSPRRESWLRG